MLGNILGDIKKGVNTHLHLNNFYDYSAFISQIVPKIISDTLTGEDCLISTQEEINQFKRNDI